MESKSITDVIFIIDNSYSVLQYHEQYLKTINSLIQIQKNVNPNSLITCILFNEHINYVHIGKPIKDVPDITLKQLESTGMTAFFDCVGSILVNISMFFEKTERNSPLVVILTDGVDTCSKRLNIKHVAFQIAKTKLEGWKFIYFGCTEESVKVGKLIGCNVNAFYNTTEQSFKNIPLLLSQIQQENIARDADFDIRQLENSMATMSVDE